MNKQGGGQISGNYGCGTEKRRVLKTKNKTYAQASLEDRVDILS